LTLPQQQQQQQQQQQRIQEVPLKWLQVCGRRPVVDIFTLG
jgi:hypothetical protein